MSLCSEAMTSPDGQEWLAMQYALGELSPDQAEEFESLLVDDEGLCDHVVRAVRLTAGVQLAMSIRASDDLPSRHRPPSFLTRCGVTAAGISLFAAMFLLSTGGLFDGAKMERVAALDDAAAVDAFVLLLSSEVSQGSTTEAEFEDFSQAPVSDLMVPEWLLSAVMLDQADAGQPESDENAEVY